MNDALLKSWHAAIDACAARGGETLPLVIEPPASEGRVAEVERALGHALPSRLRRFFLDEAASVQFQWSLPADSRPPFVDIFGGELALSLERMPELAAQNGRRGRVAIQLVANGDLVAVDVRKDREAVVYLSHDGEDSDGVILGRDLDDYLARHAAVGGVGLEEAQWLPFVAEIDGERILDPDGDAADRWRRWFGLPPRTEAGATAAARQTATAAERAHERAAWQQRADEGAPKTVDELRARLAGIPWCAQCGQGPRPFDLPLRVTWLKKGTEVAVRLASTSWANALLEARNELSSWLHHNAHDDYRSWNERVKRLKAGVLAEVEPAWHDKQKELGHGLVSTLQWIILGAALELDYLAFGHPARFFLNLLPVLEAGHLPCGWEGRWPRGELLLF